MSRPPFIPPLIIGIAGGTGSGKSEFAASLAKALGPHATLISQDWYYRDRTGISPESGLKLNFDHPSSIDNALLRKHLGLLKAGREIGAPRYNYATHRRLPAAIPLKHSPILLVEGILILHDRRLRELLDLSVFIEVPADVRLMRRIRRDREKRRIPVEETLRLYEAFVRPMHERFVEPSARHASHVWHQLTDRQFPAQFARQIKNLLSGSIQKPA